MEMNKLPPPSSNLPERRSKKTNNCGHRLYSLQNTPSFIQHNLIDIYSKYQKMPAPLPHFQKKAFIFQPKSFPSFHFVCFKFP
jgi:hypothetical protein